MLVVAIQIAALAVLANRFRQKESHQSSKTHICGLLNASEYIITSRNVVLPDGMQPAAGNDCPLVMVWRKAFLSTKYLSR